MNIKIIEKPEYISWDEIHDVLWAAHAENREKGISMKYPSLSGEEIKKRIENNGKIFVAVDGNKVIGCAAYMKKKGRKWYKKGIYAYLCFAGILPEYTGLKIYQALTSKRLHELVNTEKINTVVFDTHENNKKIISIAEHRNGFLKVRLISYNDHCNVVLAKWIDKKRPSITFIKFRYFTSSILTRLNVCKKKILNYINPTIH